MHDLDAGPKTAREKTETIARDNGKSGKSFRRNPKKSYCQRAAPTRHSMRSQGVNVTKNTGHWLGERPAYRKGATQCTIVGVPPPAHKKRRGQASAGSRCIGLSCLGSRGNGEGGWLGGGK